MQNRIHNGYYLAYNSNSRCFIHILNGMEITQEPGYFIMASILTLPAAQPVGITLT